MAKWCSLQRKATWIQFHTSLKGSMGSSPVGVKCTFNFQFPRVFVWCLPLQNVYFLVTPFLYIVQPYSFWSSSFCFSSISPNTTSTSLPSYILQMCPNKFNFLSLILRMMFLLLPILFLISSFVNSASGYKTLSNMCSIHPLTLSSLLTSILQMCPNN